MTSAVSPARIIVEADGGSRGNPGPAAYGALLRDARTGEVIAESAARLGTASNNVAEYRALIAGLELAAVHAPGAAPEVRMDSKLVIEQMAGRWKVKHPDLRPLALRAQRLAPPGTSWTWVPRARNAAADALVNAVLDDNRAEGVSTPDLLTRGTPEVAQIDETVSVAAHPAAHDPLVGWRSPEQGLPTTVVLLRHGVTTSTEARLFCGSTGSDPGLTGAGREQVLRAAEWLVRRGDIAYVVASPLRRARETAATVADRLGLDIELDDDLVELDFGDWDGLTLDQVRERWPDELARWFVDEEASPPAGESMVALGARVGRALERLLVSYPGSTVLVVSHVTPIKAVVRQALDAPAQVLHRMQVAPASLTVLQWWPDGVSALSTFSSVPA